MSTLTFQKKQWINSLQMLVGAVDKKQLLPILSTILFRYENDQMWLTATDLEIELTAMVPIEQSNAGASFTIPAKKFLDLIRTLDEDDFFEIKINDNHILINTPSTKFKLFSLPPENFPVLEVEEPNHTLDIPRTELINLLQSTAFAISQQDVRVFLNGMLFEFDLNRVTTVAADGHRMAISTTSIAHSISLTRLIVPRKSVSELLRLLNSIQDEMVSLSLYPTLLRLKTESYVFSSKLIESQFLPYHQAIPKQLNTFVLVERDTLKRALSRILIIASDKIRPVVLEANGSKLSLSAQNQEQEQATEEMHVTVDGGSIRIGINPYYLLDVLSIFHEGLVRLSFSAPDSSILVETLQNEDYQYILMPMKI